MMMRGHKKLAWGVFFVVVVAVFAVFIWPGRYDYDTEVVGWMTPDRLGSTSALFFKEGDPGWLPVKTQNRVPRLGKTPQHKVWLRMEDRGRSPWLAAETQQWSNGLLHAVKGFQFDEKDGKVNVRFADEVKSRPMKLQWPLSTRKEHPAGLQIEVVTAEWAPLAAGSEVTIVREDTTGEIRRDLVSLRATMRLKHDLAEARELNNCFYITAQNKYLIVRCFPVPEDKSGVQTPDDLPASFTVPPGQGVQAVVVSQALPFPEIASFTGFEIRHLDCGWQHELPDLPSRKTLFK